MMLIPAFASDGEFYIETNMSEYYKGELIEINGEVSHFLSDTPLIITLTTYQGDIITSDQLVVTGNKQFNTDFRLYFTDDTSYTVTADYGNESTQTNFLYYGSLVQIKTDKYSYSTHEIVHISGTLHNKILTGTALGMLTPLYSWSTNVPVYSSYDSGFSYEIKPEMGLMNYEGIYKIMRHDTGFNTEYTYFEYRGDSQSNISVTMTPDKSSYLADDIMYINGTIGVVLGSIPVILEILDTDGNTLYTKYITVSSNQNYLHKIIIKDELSISDNYIIRSSYGGTSTQNTFEYTGTIDPVIVPVNSLTITTDNNTYHEDTPIYISGQLNNSHNGTSVTISLQNPNGHISPIHNIITKNNTYSTVIPTGNNTAITTPGLYTLTAYYGVDTASVLFDYYVNSHDTQEAYFIPDSSYIVLSDQKITKWNKELTKWQNSQNKTDSNIEFYYEKLDQAISKNQTNKIEMYTERIGHSMALSSIYDSIIESLKEQLILLS